MCSRKLILILVSFSGFSISILPVANGKTHFTVTKSGKGKKADCESINFRSENDNCTENEVGLMYPIRGDCTSFLQCPELSDYQISSRIQINQCITGQIFDSRNNNCTDHFDLKSCIQMNCPAIMANESVPTIEGSSIELSTNVTSINTTDNVNEVFTNSSTTIGKGKTHDDLKSSTSGNQITCFLGVYSISLLLIFNFF